MHSRAVREVQVLNNKTNNGSYPNSQKDNQAPPAQIRFNKRSLIELATISELLPMRSNDECCNARVTASEITRTNQTSSDEGTLGKVLGFGSIGHEPGITGGCRCCEGSDGANVSLERKRVFGIDSLYRRPIHEGTSENVVNYDTGSGNLHAWVPKKQPAAISQPHIDPGFAQGQLPGICCQGNNSQGGEGESGESHESPRSRSQYLGFHPTSLTQPKPTEGACC